MPNGFLLAASSLGLPPRPLKNPPPPDETAVLAELEPKRLPDDGCCWEININSKICLEEWEFKKFPKVGLTKKKKKKKKMGHTCPNPLPLLDCWPNTGLAEEQPKPV